MEAETARIQVLVDLVPGEGCHAGVCFLSVPHVVLEMGSGGRAGRELAWSLLIKARISSWGLYPHNRVET